MLTNSKQPLLTTIFFAIVIVFTSSVSFAFSDEDFWKPTPIPEPKVQRWSDMFSLTNGVTYTFDLRGTQGRRQSLKGELTLRRQGNEIHFSYSIGSKSESGTVRNDIQTFAGEILFQAATSLSPLSATEMQLLLTPLRFIKWNDHFRRADFTRSTIWEDRSDRETIYFEAGRKWPADGIYEGTVRSRRASLLWLEIDINKPFPTKVAFSEGSWEYRAELSISRSGSTFPWGFFNR